MYIRSIESVLWMEWCISCLVTERVIRWLIQLWKGICSLSCLSICPFSSFLSSLNTSLQQHTHQELRTEPRVLHFDRQTLYH